MQSLEPIDHEALMRRLKWEDDMLAKPVADLSAYELGVVRDILQRRIDESKGNIDAGVDLLNVELSQALQRTTEDVMGMVHESTEMSERRLTEYIDDLRIVQGLLLARKPEEQNKKE